jgi:hypothetical protein
VDDDDLDFPSSFAGGLGSKRKCAVTAASSRTHSTVTAAGSQSSSVRQQSTVLKSAYRPTTKWTRNPIMVACNFQRITAWFDLDGTGQVATKESTKREVIELSSARQSESVGQPGFIGEGSTKHGIYVSPP